MKPAVGFQFSLPVTVVISAITYVYISTVFVFVDQWFGLGSSPGIINAVVFTLITVASCYNYTVAVYTDPGRVPVTFMPDVEDSRTQLHEIKRKELREKVVPRFTNVSFRNRVMCGDSEAPVLKGKLFLDDCIQSSRFLVESVNMGALFKGPYYLVIYYANHRNTTNYGSTVLKGGDLRYCQKCSHYKPPRAHHCRVCKRCVLRMDHHCIWMNNCVGHANYKVFFVFLQFAVVACVYSLILLIGSITNDSEKESQHNEGSFRTIYVISGLLLVPLSAALSILLGWHIHLILQNKTTIEHHEGVRAMWIAEKGGDIYSHPYDLGAYENLISVLGPNILYWICPTSEHIGSGLRFRTMYDKDKTATSLSK